MKSTKYDSWHARIRYIVRESSHSRINFPWFKFNQSNSIRAQLHRIGLISFNKAKPLHIISLFLWPLAAIIATCSTLFSRGKALKSTQGIGYMSQLGTMYRLMLQFNISPSYYYFYRLWQYHEDEEIFSFAQIFESVEIEKRLNRGLDVSVLSNKSKFYALCEQYDLFAPRVLGDSSEKDFIHRLQNQLGPFDLFLKPKDGLGGFGVERWDWHADTKQYVFEKQALSSQEFVTYCERKAQLGRFLVQNNVTNHRAVQDLCQAGLSTIRVVTVLGEDNKPSAYSYVYRLTSGGSIIDSLHAGGVVCNITEEGKITGGFQKTQPNQDILIHPDSQKSLVGFTVPFFNDALALACHAHTHLSHIKTIGWDVSITDQGPILVEGNAYWGMELSQMGMQKGLLQGRFEHLLGQYLHITH